MTVRNKNAEFCSRTSLGSQEPVFATASRVGVWFLLQYASPWSPEALPAEWLPAAVNQRLLGLQRNTRNSKALLIRQTPRALGPLSFFIVINNIERPLLYRFMLTSYDDLLDLDIESVLRGDSVYTPLPAEESLFLVCTHGVHDRCCAKFGLPIYGEAMRQAGDSVWQCSHVGGDRFAPNLLAFPHGLYYGHVEPGEVATIIAEYRQRRVFPARLRGRSCFPMHIQAADFFLRLQTGARGLHDFRFGGINALAPDRWEVVFTATANGAKHTLEIERGESVYTAYLSCSSTEKAPAPQYRLVKYTVEGPTTNTARIHE